MSGLEQTTTTTKKSFDPAKKCSQAENKQPKVEIQACFFWKLLSHSYAPGRIATKLLAKFKGDLKGSCYPQRIRENCKIDVPG
jgi:hypothetical protein